MSYFKAEVSMHTDGDSFQDHGHIDTITAPTKAELKAKIERNFGTIEHYIDNRYIYSCDGDYHYSIPTEERVPFTETYTFYITEVSETETTLDGVV